MNISSNYLIFRAIKFYSIYDKQAFHAILKKVDCIESFESTNEELKIEIPIDNLHDYSLRDLLGIFYRYDIEMSQLKRFLTEENKDWFCCKTAYWYERVFGSAEREKN